MSKKEKLISDVLIQWYRTNARNLPWRFTKKPYLIWLSEIILQQTSIKQGLPYYQSFVSSYPNLENLANASLDSVLKLWQGLGYYSRARNLHETSIYIHKELNGVFPNNYTDLLKLKGVGSYTAAAIASFCFGESVVVVDGNVTRFISRLFGIKEAVDIAVTEKKIKYLAQSILVYNVAATFNQAIMEFGALQCIKHNPLCNNCVFNSLCTAFKHSLVKAIPRKSKKIIKRIRHFYYAYILDTKGFVIINKRNSKDIWKGLYEFPLLESDKQLSEVPELSCFNYNYKLLSSKPSKIYTRHLTHQKIYAQFIQYEIATEHLVPKGSNHIIVSLDELKKYAVSRLIDLYLSDLSITLL